MAILDTLQSVVGNVDKAILFIRDSDALTSPKDDAAAASSYFSKVAGAVNKAKQSYKQATARMSNLNTLLEGGPDVNTDGFIPVEVQYNPSSVRIYTTGKGSGGYLVGSNNVTQASQLISQTVMDFELIFEDINNQDAFGFSSLNFNVETIYDMGKNLIQGPFSVINEVQGLLGLIHNISLQEVIFMWGQMVFKGRLTDVNVEYTMFNKDGNPIFAKVKMSIQHIYDAEDKDDLKYWDKVIDKVFKKNEYLQSYR
jgi:hypothetical protein